MRNLLKMGFHESVVPQVFDGKISTWRLRDHKFKKGDIVAFENSKTKEIFGVGKITKVVITTVGQINLKDKTHYRIYKNRQELIKAFRRRNPTYKVNNNTPVFAYTYKFESMKKRKSPILAVDGLIIERGKVLMVKQAHYPFIGYWVLPGGHVEYGETVEKAIKREMKEELGVTVKIKNILGVYSDPKRDPRYHSVSVVYVLRREKGKIRLNKESSKYNFFSLKKLPKKIGYDHRKILKDLIKSINR